MLIVPDRKDSPTMQQPAGALASVDTLAGLRQRLVNLGFCCKGEQGDALGDGTRGAIKAFQDACGLIVTGEPDSIVRAVLMALHQS